MRLQRAMSSGRKTLAALWVAALAAAPVTSEAVQVWGQDPADPAADAPPKPQPTFRQRRRDAERPPTRTRRKKAPTKPNSAGEARAKAGPAARGPAAEAKLPAAPAPEAGGSAAAATDAPAPGTPGESAVVGGAALAEPPKAPEAPAPEVEATPEATPPIEHGRGVQLGGQAFSSVFAPLERMGTRPMQQVFGSIWLEGRAGLSEAAHSRWALVAETLPQSVVASDRSLSFRVHEAYFAWAKSGWEIRAGQQLHVWGNADGYNPTDLLTAQDLTVLGTEEELRRRGSLNLMVSWAPPLEEVPVSVTAVWAPVFPRSSRLLPSSALPQVAMAEPIVPEATLKNSELGARASVLGSGWDVAVVAFRGFHHLPEYSLVWSADAHPSLAPVYPRMIALGAEASATYEKWVFRFEGARRWTDNRDGDPVSLPTHWDGVVGVERPIGDRFRAQAQFLWRAYPQWRAADQARGSTPQESALLQRVASLNALLLDFQDYERKGATFRLTYTTEDEDLEASVLGVVRWKGGDYYLRPSASYRFTEGVRLGVGIDYYGGPEERLLGALKDFRSLFAEVKWTF